MRPHSNLFTQHPLVHLAVAFSAGICTASYLSLRFSLAAGIASTTVMLILFVRQRLRLAVLSLLSALFFTGVTLAELERRVDQARALKNLVEQSEGEPFTLTGWLDGPPEFARDRVYLSLRVENVAGRVSLLVTLRDINEFRALQLRYGTRIQVITTLDRDGNYRNPGVSSLAEFLDRNGYDASGLIKSPTAITRLGDTRVFPPLAWLYDWRSRLQQQIDTSFQPETAGVLDATLLGNRYNLSTTASERFREGGTFHVLVISGLHISFIGAVVFLIVKRLTRRRLLQFVLPALIVWAYSFAVGADASVVRAALMFTFAGVATILFRQSSSLNALGGAALVLLVHRPKELFDPSFQLTFLSVLAILVIAWPLLSNMSAIGAWYPTRYSPYPPMCARGFKYICEVLFWREKRWAQEIARSTHDYHLFKAPVALRLERYYVQPVLRYTFGAVVVSASVQLMLLPLMIVYFHRLSLASLVLNIVVSILLAVLVVVALLALMIGQVPLFKLADAINWLMVHSVDPFSDFGWAGFRLPEYSGPAALIYAIYYLPLLILIIALLHWRPMALQAERRCKLHAYVLPLTCAQLLLLTVLILHPFSSRSDARLRIDFLDVGQGDSALVTMPDGTTLLVDAGGNTMDSTRRIGETVVSEYLWRRGLSEIDYVLATHADADHIDGLNDVLKNFTVRSALIARSPADDPEFAKFAQTLARTNTHSETIEAGDVIYFGDVIVSVLWPSAGGEKSTNNDSIVLRIQYGERSILLTGDIEQAAERALIASPQQLHADVIKVPHHGSKTSSTDAFVSATNPQFAIISVGRTSRFGHPHKEVVERWQSSGATVLTTGHSGTITITTDGHDLSLKTLLQPQKGTKNF
ncbi:MAG TPA: DNA internalization-related competence protein ComEC/Rec2 [Pyrinomonadaceae bacterium]|nr:DNA internalization-related competence protein ComEC/Rec2 [Pyrinomonadaceae bacterium]